MMSQAQRVKFMAELWPKACAAQGWNRTDSAKRYEVFAQVLGDVPRHAKKLERGEHISFNDFDNSDFDKVKAHCGMLANNVQATIETDYPELGDGRRLHHMIEQELTCLSLYIDNPKAYLVPVLRAKFKGKTRIDDLSPEPILKDHGTIPSELERCLYTLRTILNKKRKEAGHTLHEMKLLAKIPCSCTICIPRRPTVLINTAIHGGGSSPQVSHTLSAHSGGEGRGEEGVSTDNEPF